MTDHALDRIGVLHPVAADHVLKALDDPHPRRDPED